MSQCKELPFEEGDWTDFATWTSYFDVGGRSGINYSKKNRVIVCITDNPPYEDEWYTNSEWDGVRFTGQGLRGNQEMKGANRSLKESLQTNTPIHVLRKAIGENRKVRYLYCGMFVLKTPVPRIEFQKDVDGLDRSVFIFNLAAKNNRICDKVMQNMIATGMKIKKI